jgi:hypothetical protein
MSKQEIRPALKNPRHEAFAQALARGMSASAAYVEAGYKANRHNAAALAREEHVGTRITELQEEQLAIHKQATAEAVANAKVTIPCPHELLKKPEIQRDDIGRFERKGMLAKSAKFSQDQKTEITGPFKPGQSGNPAGKPKGTLNKTTIALKQAILGALEAAGGDEGSVGYLKRLAIENSSAFASLFCKVLPTTLAASESDGGIGVKMVFERHIVWPDGHREIEGVTPKHLPAPDVARALPGLEQSKPLIEHDETTDAETVARDDGQR